MASGVPEVASQVIDYQGRMQAMVISALRDEPFSKASASTTEMTEREQTLVFMLLQNWFAALVGWSAGLGTVSSVITQMDRAIQVISRGLAPEAEPG